jgi:hypothetical protein
MITTRPGAALLEALVAALLATIVVATAALLLQAQSRIARNMSERSERNDAARSAAAILRSELQLIAETDLGSVTRDSIGTRIFRGLATICAYDAQQTYARYRGLRLPDPAKDSALEVGIETVIKIDNTGAAASACVPEAGEEIISLTWSGVPRVGAMWLVFETGAYHFNANALRYRRPGETRQPITNTVFDDSRSGFHLIRDTVPRGIEVILQDRHVPNVLQMPIRLRNAR